MTSPHFEEVKSKTALGTALYDKQKIGIRFRLAACLSFEMAADA